jgi:hypothetical protein
VTGSIYVRIIPETALEHGWRLRELLLYGDEQCTTDPLKFQDVSADLPEPANSERDTTWTRLTSQSKLYTGPPGVVDIGYSHYPHPTDLMNNAKPFKYSNINLVDEQNQKDVSKLTSQWWSECLQCEAEGLVIEFALVPGTILGCVRVIQVGDHGVDSLRVEWGPAAGKGCGMAPGQTRCPPTMI